MSPREWLDANYALYTEKDHAPFVLDAFCDYFHRIGAEDSFYPGRREATDLIKAYEQGTRGT